MATWQQFIAETMTPTCHIPPQVLGASSTLSGTAISMTGWDGCMFMCLKGAGDRTLDMKIQRDDNSGFSSATDISNATITQIGTGTTNVVRVCMVQKTTETYMRAYLTSGSGGSTLLVAVSAIRYRRMGGVVQLESEDVVLVQES